MASRNPDEQSIAEKHRETGHPGAGQAQRNEPGRSGVSPMSGGHPPGPAEIRTERPPAGAKGSPGIQAGDVQIPMDSIALEGNLAIPDATRGVVVFAHGSGSSRHSSRNHYVAAELQDAGFATLLMDLLTSEEEAIDNRTAALRFNIDLLAKRLKAATWWLVEQRELSDLPIGYFGASTGAAAALIAAAGQADLVSALVTRGGRPDLAGAALDRVLSPTLLIVGSLDVEVLELNRRALATIAGKRKKLEIVPGAAHSFEEAGALETVARLARDWFGRYLTKGAAKHRAA